MIVGGPQKRITWSRRSGGSQHRGTHYAGSFYGSRSDDALTLAELLTCTLVCLLHGWPVVGVGVALGATPYHRGAGRAGCGGWLHARSAPDLTAGEVARMVGAEVGRRPRLVSVPPSVLKKGASLVGRPEAASKICDPMLMGDDLTRAALGLPVH